MSKTSAKKVSLKTKNDSILKKLSEKSQPLHRVKVRVCGQYILPEEVCDFNQEIIRQYLVTTQSNNVAVSKPKHQMKIFEFGFRLEDTKFMTNMPVHIFSFDQIATIFAFVDLKTTLVVGMFAEGGARRSVLFLEFERESLLEETAKLIGQFKRQQAAANGALTDFHGRQISESEVFNWKLKAQNEVEVTGKEAPEEATKVELENDGISNGVTEIRLDEEIENRPLPIPTLELDNDDDNNSLYAHVSRNHVASIEVLVHNHVQPIETSVHNHVQPIESLVHNHVQPIETSVHNHVQPIESSAYNHVQPIETSAYNHVQPIETSAYNHVQPIESSAYNHVQPIETSAYNHVQPIESSAYNHVQPIESSVYNHVQQKNIVTHSHLENVMNRHIQPISNGTHDKNWNKSTVHKNIIIANDVIFEDMSDSNNQESTEITYNMKSWRKEILSEPRKRTTTTVAAEQAKTFDAVSNTIDCIILEDSVSNANTPIASGIQDYVAHAWRGNFTANYERDNGFTNNSNLTADRRNYFRAAPYLPDPSDSRVQASHKATTKILSHRPSNYVLNENVKHAPHINNEYCTICHPSKKTSSKGGVIIPADRVNFHRSSKFNSYHANNNVKNYAHP